MQLDSPEVGGAEVDPHGRGKLFLFRHSSRATRLAELEAMAVRGKMSEAERAELSGRLSAEDTYNAAEEAFSEEHRKFKQAHSRVFASLITFCSTAAEATPKVFLLDGASGRTCQVLKEAEISLDNVYVANRHLDTVNALRTLFPRLNVAHASAALALKGVVVGDEDRGGAAAAEAAAAEAAEASAEKTAGAGAFSEHTFSAFYVDACGGAPWPVIEILEAALSRPASSFPPRVAIGFSILGGARTVADRELAVCRAVVKLSKRLGFQVKHVLEDPEAFGIDDSVTKGNEETITEWLVLEKIEQDAK